ncbi:MAG TPA: patatin-like phospholipase family protein [Acidimicrobiia bacterium]
MAYRRAFVLGGGGHRGAFEVGMLKALLERGLRPDLIVGTSIGAFNGVVIAERPTSEGVARLEETWRHLTREQIFEDSLWRRASIALRRRTHIHSNDSLRRIIEDTVSARTFAELAVTFQCVAASIELAREHWFDQGNLVDAVLASSAVPGLLPPVELGGSHYIDGGVVNSIPISRAFELGASEVYVLHVGHIDDPLTAPTQPWEVAMVAFEIARRGRFLRHMEHVPEGVTVHVLPTGKPDAPYSDRSKLRYSDFTMIGERIDQAYRATATYLDGKGA